MDPHQEDDGGAAPVNAGAGGREAQAGDEIESENEAGQNASATGAQDKPRRPKTHSATQWRNMAAFFVFGLVNNVIYVIFLSAAEDILTKNQEIPKSTVLLANILPCLMVKMTVPYFVRIVPYGTMVSSCVFLSLLSLVLVGWTSTISLKFLGIIVASVSSGLGETCFLALTSYYGPSTVISWSSGTGAAGIVGSVYYLVMSSVFELSMKTSLTIACILPLLMALAYTFVVTKKLRGQIVVESDEALLEPLPDKGAAKGTDEGLLDDSTSFLARVRMINPLFLRYILPLFWVYYAEYTINQSVFYSLMYPLEKTPFKEYKDHYKTYQAIYQTGVFVSRTFGRVVPVGNLWIFVCLQCGMLVLLSLETHFSYMGSIYVVFVLVLFEGLLGGAAYVNTFCNIAEQVERRNLEFSMAFTGIADSLGIGLAGLTCLAYEPFLCSVNAVCTSLKDAT